VIAHEKIVGVALALVVAVLDIAVDIADTAV